jgi:hypothetical protein
MGLDRPQFAERRALLSRSDAAHDSGTDHRSGRLGEGQRRGNTPSDFVYL